MFLLSSPLFTHWEYSERKVSLCVRIYQSLEWNAVKTLSEHSTIVFIGCQLPHWNGNIITMLALIIIQRENICQTSEWIYFSWCCRTCMFHYRVGKTLFELDRFSHLWHKFLSYTNMMHTHKNVACWFFQDV